MNVSSVMSIRELVEKAVDAFQQHGYTERSVGEKEWILLKVVDQHEKYGATFYNADLVAKFNQDSKERYENGEIQRTHYRFLIKTVSYLTELHSNGIMNLAAPYVPQLLDYYENLLNKILTNENWSIKSRRSVRKFARAYFGWLTSEGFSDMNRVDESVVRQYLINCSSRLSASSLDTTKRGLKKLCAFLYEIGYGSGSYENLLSFSVPIEHKVKRPIPHSEIAAVLNVIDRSSAIGKRDYAMIMLATVTGLREIDIAGLSFNDIDWRNGEIKIIQSKTENSLALPLTTDVGTAIKDYIINSRPESSLENVFLRTNAPIDKITTTILYCQFNSYRAKVGLPKCSFHGLRRVTIC